MIDIRTETLIRLEDVRHYIPSSRKGKKLGKAACFRWANNGVDNIVLETIRVGGARLTSVEAIQRFVNAQNSIQSQPTRPRKDAATRAEKAADALDKRGFH